MRRNINDVRAELQAMHDDKPRLVEDDTQLPPEWMERDPSGPVYPEERL